MWLIWVQLSLVATGMIFYFLYTIVFCFWFIYLLDAMKRKRSFYKTMLKCVQGESDLHQQMLAYNAKTELVKFVSVFCLNIIEWITGTFGNISLTTHFVINYQHKFPINRTLSLIGEWDSKLYVPYFGNVFITISLCIAGNLCMYLSARYAQKSWIKSYRIPIWICFFLLGSIAAQFLVTICYTHFIGMCCSILLVALSVIFAWKQYRKLNMVIQWSIVDLSVSGNIELLEKHVRMKRRFNRIWTTIWIGVSCILVANFIYGITQTTRIILHLHDHSFTDVFFYGIPSHSHYYPESYTISFLYLMKVFLTIMGVLIFSIPYIGYGLCTMFVLLWRLFRGKTGYRTHFHVEISRPLV